MKRFKSIFYKIKFKIYLKDYLNIMRLRKNSKNTISSIKFGILDINYNFDKYFTNKIFKTLPINFSIFFSQYNYYRLIRTQKINPFILKVKNFTYPLCKEQIYFLKKNNLFVNNFSSRFLFLLYALKEFLFGLMIYFFINFNFIFSLFKRKKIFKKKLFINNLLSDQINSFDQTSNNIEKWIKSNFKLDDYTLVHNNKKCRKKFLYSRFFLPELDKFNEILKFNIFFFKYFTWMLLDLFFLRLKQIFIFSELVKLSCVISKEKMNYNNYYFFFTEDPFFRPLYTYFIGKNVYYFPQHININSIYLNDEIKEKEIYWKNLTWNNYILWNESHKNMVFKNQILEAKYFILGPVSFGTKNDVYNQTKFKKPSILVFDAVAFRRSFISNYNVYASHYHENNLIKFLKDISKLRNDYNLYLKPKKKIIPNYFSKKYLSYIDNNKCFNLIDTAYSARDAIEKCDKIICIPFSSTAYVAKDMEKKVCFYDVVGIHKNFREDIDGIPLIKNFSKLQDWILN